MKNYFSSRLILLFFIIMLLTFSAANAEQKENLQPPISQNPKEFVSKKIRIYEDKLKELMEHYEKICKGLPQALKQKQQELEKKKPGEVVIVPAKRELMKSYKIKIIQVIPNKGNNPLNQQQPVFNRDGRTFSSLAKMLGEGQVPGAQVPAGVVGAGCIGSSIAFKAWDIGGAAGIEYQAGISLDPNTGKCFLTDYYRETTTLVFGFSDKFGPEAAPAGVQTWGFTPPSPVNGYVAFSLDGINETYYLVYHPTGMKVKITANVSRLAPTSFRLNVVSIDQL